MYCIADSATINNKYSLETSAKIKQSPTFLDRIPDRFVFQSQEWVNFMGGGNSDASRAKPDFVVYHESGEPLLPDYEGAGLGHRRDIMKTFLNVHYCQYMNQSV